MLFVRAGLSLTLLAALATTAVYANHVRHSPTSRHSRSTAHKHKALAKSKIKGQRQIDTDRAREIQQALIHENYLSGEPTGQWDAETRGAMQRFQADHGWQTKIMPDSRALIKLGLGPVGADNSTGAPGAAQTQPARSQDTYSLLDDGTTRPTTRSTGR